MTYEVRVTIWCDHDECEERIEFSSRNSGGLNKTSAGTYARLNHGWSINSRDPKKALCPKHAPKEG